MQSCSLAIALNNFCFAFLTWVWTQIQSPPTHTKPTRTCMDTVNILWAPANAHIQKYSNKELLLHTYTQTHALLINLPVKFIYQLCSLCVSRSSTARESHTKIRWVAVLKTATPSRLHINSPGRFIQRLRCLFLGLGPSVGPSPP